MTGTTLTNPDFVYNICESLRLTCVSISTLAYDRSFVPIGQPVWEASEDCSTQLTVSWVRGFAAAPGRIEDRSRTNAIRTAVRPALDLEVQFVRCVTGMDDDGEPPTALELAADAKEIMSEAWALWVGLQNAKFTNALWTAIPDVEDEDFTPPECARVDIDPVVPMGPQGNRAGYKIPLLVSLG